MQRARKGSRRAWGKHLSSRQRVSEVVQETAHMDRSEPNEQGNDDSGSLIPQDRKDVGV